MRFPLFAAALVAAILAAPGNGLGGTLHAHLTSSPASGGGRVAWKAWSAAVPSAWLKRVRFEVPLVPYLNEDALQSLAGSEGVRVGQAEIQFFKASDWVVAAQAVPLETGRCPDDRAPAVGLFDEWRLLIDRNGPPDFPAGCMTVALERVGDRLAFTVDTAATTRGNGILLFELRLVNRATEAGSLLRPNPAWAVSADSLVSAVTCTGFGDGDQCGADRSSFRRVVREVVGGDTRVSLVLPKRPVIAQSRAVFRGRVLRGGRPSAGERVYLQPYWLRRGADASARPESRAVALTDRRGRFEIRTRVNLTSRWQVKAYRAASASRAQLATLTATPSRPVVARAPRPQIAKVDTRTLPGGRIGATIVVRNQLGLSEALTCRLRAGDRTFTRRFPFTGDTLRFRVSAEAGTWVRASVFRNEPANDPAYFGLRIAPGYSKRIPL